MRDFLNCQFQIKSVQRYLLLQIPPALYQHPTANYFLSFRQQSLGKFQKQKDLNMIFLTK